MKRLMTLVSLFLFLTCWAAPAQAAAPDKRKNPPKIATVVLTAPQVHSAIDIEQAILTATASGTRPGRVVLDGSQGPFIYDEGDFVDRAINIFVSDLTLLGANEAVIQGGDGIAFDAVTADRIKIHSLTMHCNRDCLVSWGPHDQVAILSNHFYAENLGLQIAQTGGWRVEGNTIQAGANAVELIEASGIKLLGNRLSGFIPVVLYQSQGCRIQNNLLEGRWQGILLRTPSLQNRVTANRIRGVQAAGIALEPGTEGNRVHGNRVSCEPGYACLTVDAQPPADQDNIISGNRP